MPDYFACEGLDPNYAYNRLVEAPHPKYSGILRYGIEKVVEPYVKEMTYVPNRSNKISEYMTKHWPQLSNVKGVWVVGSTAYMLADDRVPNGDLDLICADEKVLAEVIQLIATTKDALTKTYMGGDRVYSQGRQVDAWTLQPGQTIDDAIKGFSSTHPQARVAFEISTGRLIVYPNEHA